MKYENDHMRLTFTVIKTIPSPFISAAFVSTQSNLYMYLSLWISVSFSFTHTWSMDCLWLAFGQWINFSF